MPEITTIEVSPVLKCFRFALNGLSLWGLVAKNAVGPAWTVGGGFGFKPMGLWFSIYLSLDRLLPVPSLDLFFSMG